MIIIAGTLHVSPDDRDRYLDAVRDVADEARRFPGCLDFSQSPDPNDPGRINIFERWDSDEALLAFRNSGTDDDAQETPEILGADVAKYRISAVESP